MNTATAIPAGTKAQVRVLATTDLHMNLTGFDYCSDRPDPSAGLTRVATLIQTARKEARAKDALTLLLDNGDALQGEPFDAFKHDSHLNSHPMIEAMQHLKYDACGLGNHDFNHGLEFLDNTLVSAPFPFICTNLIRVDGAGNQTFARFAILEREICAHGQTLPIRIGLLSFVPPQTVQWDHHHLYGRVIAQDVITTAKTWVGALRQRGCDLIIALAHTGIENNSGSYNQENAAIPLASVQGIDAVIAGHSHRTLPGPDHAGMHHVDAERGLIHGTPAVMPGTGGSHVGVIDLELRSGTDGRWHVAASTCTLRPVATRADDGQIVPLTTEDQTLKNLIAPHHNAAVVDMNQKVGTSDQNLHSYFATFAPDRSLACLAVAQAASVRSVLDKSPVAELPVLSAVSASKTGGRSGPQNYTDVPAGTVLRRHIVDLHVFPNQIRATILDGAGIKDWLEKSASAFHQITPGSRGAGLMDPAFPGYMFDVIFGLTYKIDVTEPARYCSSGALKSEFNSRVRDLRFRGQRVDPQQRFVVILNSYRASGGGGFPAIQSSDPVVVPAIEIHEALTSYFLGKFPPDPLENATNPWRFEHIPETRVAARTGPGAQKYLGELSERNVQTHGTDSSGHLKLSFDL